MTIEKYAETFLSTGNPSLQICIFIIFSFVFSSLLHPIVVSNNKITTKFSYYQDLISWTKNNKSKPVIVNFLFIGNFSFIIKDYLRPTLKNCMFPITCIAEKKSHLGSQYNFFFFTLFKLNVAFYFKCYLHHNCSINLNWNNTQLYSKPLHNVPSSVFWFVNFCFLPFLRRTSIQKWKKNWFCYVHRWIGKKEMLAKTSKCLCRNLYIEELWTNQNCVQRSQNPRNFEKVYYFVFKFLDSQHKISIVLWLSYLWKHVLFIWRQYK